METITSRGYRTSYNPPRRYNITDDGLGDLPYIEGVSGGRHLDGPTLSSFERRMQEPRADSDLIFAHEDLLNCRETMATISYEFAATGRLRSASQELRASTPTSSGSLGRPRRKTRDFGREARERAKTKPLAPCSPREPLRIGCKPDVRTTPFRLEKFQQEEGVLIIASWDSYDRAHFCEICLLFRDRMNFGELDGPPMTYDELPWSTKGMRMSEGPKARRKSTSGIVGLAWVG